MDGMLILGVVVAGIAGVMIWSWVHEKKRTEAIAQVAQELNLEFTAHPLDWTSYLKMDFDLFQKGRSRIVSNLIEGRSHGTKVSIFDYRYKHSSSRQTNSGSLTVQKKSEAYQQQTVVLIGSDQLDLPTFSLYPETIFHWLANVVGFQDINFEDYPTFSKRYRLVGQDEPAIRERFQPEVLTYFEERTPLTVEARPHRLLIYRAGKRVKPQQIPELLEEAFGVHVLLKNKG